MHAKKIGGAGPWPVKKRSFLPNAPSGNYVFVFGKCLGGVLARFRLAVTGRLAQRGSQTIFFGFAEPESYEKIKSSSYLVSRVLQSAGGTMYVAHVYERFVAIALDQMRGRLGKRRSKSKIYVGKLSLVNGPIHG